MPLNFFNRLEYMEPRCSKCKTVLEFGINTHFDSEKECHVCNKCNAVLKNIYDEVSAVKLTDFDMQ